MSGICPYMNGAKCAKNYCDMWNKEHQMCGKAVEAHRHAEVLRMVLIKAEELKLKKEEEERKENLEDRKKIEEMKKKLNIVDVSTVLN